MEIAIISITAFATAILTFFSGFGLGTILTPVFMLFFPVELAIALTGIVHFFNNVFKLILVGRNANKDVLMQFGIPAILAAFLGSLVLLNITNSTPLFSYDAFGNHYEVYPIKFMVSILLILFAGMDLIPYFKKLNFGKDKLILGGLLSGFFGGLSGNQGALRSAFLLKVGLTKESLVGTAVVVSTFVDFTRLGVYATRFEKAGLFENLELVVWATLSAIMGAYLGNKLLKKVTMELIQILTAVFLLIIALGLGLGIL
jgi:uncharacterized membrane protein YfcA